MTSLNTSLREPCGREYYDVNYRNYERQNSAKKIRFYLCLLEQRISPRDTIFELGCGLGRFLQQAAKTYSCFGCDLNEYGVALTRKTVPTAVVLQGSYQTLPRDLKPKAVVAWDVLEHLPDLSNALTCIHTGLDEQGYLLGVVPIYDGPLGWITKHLDQDPTHLTKWSRSAWLNSLKNHGYEVVDWGGIIRRLFMDRWYVHATRPQCVLRHYCSAMYFVARVRS